MLFATGAGSRDGVGAGAAFSFSSAAWPGAAGFVVSDIVVLGSSLGQGTRQRCQQQVRGHAWLWVPTTYPGPHPALGTVALGWRAQQWGAWLGPGEELPGGSPGRHRQLGPAFTRRTTGGPGCPQSPSVIRSTLRMVPPLQGCPKQSQTLVPSRSMLSLLGLGSDAAPGAGAIPHGVCLRARLGTGAACEGVGRGQPSLHEALRWVPCPWPHG